MATQIENTTPTLHGIPIDQEPASLDDAIKEQAERLDDLRAIDEQLSRPYIERDGKRLNQKEYADWRRRALVSRRFTERRYRFVKQWIKDQAKPLAPLSPPRQTEHGMAATTQARSLARRISYMESIAMAAAEYVRHQSPQTLAELERRVEENGEKAGV